MSLLTICQQVARIVRIAVPDTIVGADSEEASLLLAAAQEAGEALARRPPGGWTQMMREYTFTTVAVGPVDGTANGTAVITGLPSTALLAADTFYCMGTNVPNNTLIASVDSPTQVTLTNAVDAGTVSLTFGQSDYSLPSDFERSIDMTQWDRTRYWAMRGPLSAQQWQLYKSSVLGRATIQRRYRFRNIGGVNRLSIDPVPTDNDSTLVFEYVSNAWCASSLGVPQTQWLADTDVGILDEYLIGLSVKWRTMERLGLAYEAALSEYERQESKAVAQDGGAPTLDLTPTEGVALLTPYAVPETGFGNVTGS